MQIFFKKVYKIKCHELKKLNLNKLIKIKVNYKQKHLGCFENIEDAAKAVKEARAHYGFHVNHGQTND